MWLVLCDSTDAPARWAFHGLQRRGLEPAELVTSDDLAHARWEQHVGEEGVRISIGLRDGRVLRSDAVRGTLNRLLYPPQGNMLLIQPGDRTYIFQEMMALFMGWLDALPGPMLNNPAPECLCGRVRSLTEWVWLAGRAGLPTASVRISSDDQPVAPSMYVRISDPGAKLTTLLIVGDHIVGPAAPAEIAAGCRRLAALADVTLLGLEFSDNWTLAGVTAMPNLCLGGEALLDALAATMRNGHGMEG